MDERNRMFKVFFSFLEAFLKFIYLLPNCTMSDSKAGQPKVQLYSSLISNSQITAIKVRSLSLLLFSDDKFLLFIWINLILASLFLSSSNLFTFTNSLLHLVSQTRLFILAFVSKSGQEQPTFTARCHLTDK